MDPKEKTFFFKSRADKAACKLMARGATAWVLPNPGFFFTTWICFWYSQFIVSIKIDLVS